MQESSQKFGQISWLCKNQWEKLHSHRILPSVRRMNLTLGRNMRTMPAIMKMTSKAQSIPGWWDEDEDEFEDRDEDEDEIGFEEEYEEG